MLYPSPIELELGLNLEGSFNRLDVFEAVPTNVSHVISTTEAWGVNLDWEISSQIPGNPHSPLMMSNIFRVNVYLEGFGPGANEFSLPTAPQPYFLVNYGASAGSTPGGAVVNPTTRTWAISIPFTPPTVSIPAGLYKLGVVLQMLIGPDSAPTHLPAAGFVEGPLIQFY